MAVSVTVIVVSDATAPGGTRSEKGTPETMPCWPSIVTVPPDGPIVADAVSFTPRGHSTASVGPGRRVHKQVASAGDPLASPPSGTSTTKVVHCGPPRASEAGPASCGPTSRSAPRQALASNSKRSAAWSVEGRRTRILGLMWGSIGAGAF